MKQITLDVEGLSDEQIALVRSLILKMKQAQNQVTSLEELREFLWRGVNRDNVLSEDEAAKMAKQLIRQARNQ